MADEDKPLTDEEIQLTFRVMDKDGDGLITMPEFRDFLVKIEAIQDPVRDEKVVKTMFEMFDKNCDGRLSFEETKEALKRL